VIQMVGSESKVCTKCGIEKPLSMFHKDGNKYRSDCKVCRSATTKIYRNNNLEKVKNKCKKYRESHREELIDYLKQYRKENKQELKIKRKQKHLTNPEIRYLRDKKYRENHHEKVISNFKAWMQTPSGKASFARMRHKRLSALNKTECTLTSKQWEKILAMQNNHCADCGREFSDTLKPARDHIIPLSLGGGLTFGNVQALCKSCNSKKKNRFDISNSLERVFNDNIFYMKVGQTGYVRCDFTSI
jgi:5-methylcytosine-specific restriction endonuclease McrA